MNGYNTLELILKDILLAVNPSGEDWSVRFYTIKELQAVVESIETLRDGWGRIEFISNARVPIIKLVSGYGISCDISINNLCGQMKSKLLLWINEIDGRSRDLVLLVKEWAKAHNINDPKSGTLNSYSLSLEFCGLSSADFGTCNITSS